MAITIDGTNGITSPGGDSSAVDVTTPKVKNAGTLALEATGANVITFSNNSAESARIDASGVLFVGTTTLRPSQANVVGIAMDTRLNSLALSVTGNNQTPAEFNLRGTNGNVVNINRDGTTVGSISASTTTTFFNTSSDYRLKEDVQPVLNPIDRLMQLKPINFAWKVDGSRVDGFLAHEAQAVVPEAVTGEKDEVDEEGNPVHQGIDQSKLVPLLTAAIQEQQTLIQALTARIEALEVA